MITIPRKHNPAHRTLLLLSIPLITTALLFIGSMAFHLPGIPLIASAHAMVAKERIVAQKSLQTPCASNPTGPHCNHQDPMIQGCNRDAQTLSFHDIPNMQGIILATVQRRYSPTCHSEWGRIITSPGNHQPISISIGTNGIQASPGPIAFTPMVFVPNLSRASEIKGTISTNGITPGQANSAGLTVILPALPSPPQ